MTPRPEKIEYQNHPITLEQVENSILPVMFDIYRVFLSEPEKAQIKTRIIVRTCRSEAIDTSESERLNLLSTNLIRFFKVFKDNKYTTDQIKSFYEPFLELTKDTYPFRIFEKFYNCFIQYLEANGDKKKEQIAMLKNLSQELRIIFKEALEIE